MIILHKDKIPPNLVKYFNPIQNPPAKNNLGIPWRVALALQADGWTLRSDIVWAKPNPMPESVKDRPTKAHEFIFLFSKSQRYFYDSEAIREPAAPQSIARIQQSNFANQTGGPKDYGTTGINPNRSMRQTLENFAANPGRNKRTVWNVATTPYPGSHFATWPPALVEPMIKSGTSEYGVCPHCGAPWRRVTAKETTGRAETNRNDDGSYPGGKSTGLSLAEKRQAYRTNGMEGPPPIITTGWEPTCRCADKNEPPEPVPAIVLDPFVGSGTTLMVARQLVRSAIGLDLSFPYLRDQVRSRLDLDKLDAWQHGSAPTESTTDETLPLFTL